MTENRRSSEEARSDIILAQGTAVSHYRIVEKIGAGEMSGVYVG